MGKTVVSYCTGGIRCEKAAMVLAGSRGWTGLVYQLDGGILKYFEDTGGKPTTTATASSSTIAEASTADLSPT